MDVKVDIDTLKKILDWTGNRAFESQRHIVTTYGEISIWADKPNKKRIQKESFKMLKFGYASISSIEK